MTAVVSTVPRELNTGLSPVEKATASEFVSSIWRTPPSVLTAAKVPVGQEALLRSSYVLALVSMST